MELLERFHLNSKTEGFCAPDKSFKNDYHHDSL